MYSSQSSRQQQTIKTEQKIEINKKNVESIFNAENGRIPSEE
jgi:hypothetical protein